MGQTIQILDAETIKRSLTRITHEILERNNGASNIVILGVKNKGIAIAKILVDNIFKFSNDKINFGILDVTPFRDDLSLEERKKIVSETNIPFDINNKDVIIIDDVLYTGRTIRAAIEHIFNIGRPKTVQLGVLIDRGHREVPIRPDYVGKNVPSSKEETIIVKISNSNSDGVFISK